MIDPPLLVLGNRLDLLARFLAEEIERDGYDPLASRLIIVPDSGIKSWLLLELARHSSKKGVAGLKVMAWKEAIRFLLNRAGKEPTSLELYLLVYDALKRSRKEEIVGYLEDSAEKLVDLARELTELFLIYGYFGKELFESLGSDWQCGLLRELFIEGPWRLPVQLLSRTIETGPVYCFGCNSLPMPVWDFLLRLPRLEIFHFSPCLSYWGDSCSDRERRNLTRFWKKRSVSEERLDELDGYLRDSHPLLANWGKLGRDTLNFLDRYEMQVEEVYDPLDGDGLLKGLQRDLLFHEESEKAADRSLWIGLTGSSRLREIQVLRDEILRARERGIAFSEMSVLAPDLEVYAPLIELVFSDSELEIPFRMAGIDQLARNSRWQGFKKLLNLSRSRWEADRLLELFENLSFRSKQGWDLERLDRIRSWIRDAKIRWGRDGGQRSFVISELLGAETEANLRGTWEEGADRIVNGMIYLFPEDWAESPHPSPISGVDLGEADEVESLLALIDELQRDLKPLSDQSLRTMGDWAKILQDLSEKYLSIDDSYALDEIFRSMRYSGENIDGEFPFLSDLFNRKSDGQMGSSSLHAVRFASLEEGSILPCRALFLIGQDEESFPRKNRASSLNLLRGGKEAPPTNSERDRYLFLQAICSACDLIAISYGHISPEDGKDIGPSILVQELQSYLKIVPVVVHPNFALHSRCFQADECRSMSQKAYRAAQVFYGKKEPLKIWAPFNQRPEGVLPEGELVVNLRDLSSLFRHPWKFYLQKNLNLRIEEDETENWEDFEIDFIKRAQIFRSSLEQPLESVIDRLDQKGSFPVGLFGKMARLNLTDTLSEWKENLTEFGLDSLKTLRLRDVRSEAFDFAPLELEWDRLKVKIVGDVKYCTSSGPLLLGDANLQTVLRSWPELLTALVTLNTNRIFSLRTGKVLLVESPKEALRRCIELYFLGLQTPLPLISEWAEPLLRKGAEDLQKKIDAPQSFIEDPVYDWVCARMETPSADEIFTCWGNYLRTSLSGLSNLFPGRGG